MSAISGSPLVNDATDFNTGIFRARGEIVTIGKTVLFHAASVAEMVKHIIADCSASPGIRPGDMFMVNHPYKGALHPPDFGLVAPAFHDDAAYRLGRRVLASDRRRRLVRHRSDRSLSGRHPGAAACVSSRTTSSARDMMAMMLGMSRLPVNMSLDFRGMMAANRVALQRLAGDHRPIRHRHRAVGHGRRHRSVGESRARAAA